MHLARKNMLEELRCHFLQKNFVKKLLLDPDFVTNTKKNRNEENIVIYVKQRNYCVALLRKSKKKYYENFGERNLMDNKLFWKTITLSFSDKIVTRDRIHLTENGEVVKTELEMQRLSIFFLEMQLKT